MQHCHASIDACAVSCTDMSKEYMLKEVKLQGNGQRSIQAELAFQKQLAKQLGVKGRTKSKAKGPDDGLDDFLEGSAERLSAEHAGL